MMRFNVFPILSLLPLCGFFAAAFEDSPSYTLSTHSLFRRIDSANCDVDTADIASRLLKTSKVDPDTMIFYHGDFRQDAMEMACDNADLNGGSAWFPTRPSVVLPMVYYDWTVKDSSGDRRSPFDRTLDPYRCYLLSDRRRDYFALLSMTFADLAKGTVYFVWDGKAPMSMPGVDARPAWRSQWDEFIYPILVKKGISIKTVHPQNRVISDYELPQDSKWYGVRVELPDGYVPISKKLKRGWESVESSPDRFGSNLTSSDNFDEASAPFQIQKRALSYPGSPAPLYYGPFCTSKACRECVANRMSFSQNTEATFGWGYGRGYARGQCKMNILQASTCGDASFTCQDLIIDVLDDEGAYIGSTDSSKLAAPVDPVDVPVSIAYAVKNAWVPAGSPWTMDTTLPFKLQITAGSGQLLKFNYNGVAWSTQRFAGAQCTPLTDGAQCCIGDTQSDGRRELRCTFACP